MLSPRACHVINVPIGAPAQHRPAAGDHALSSDTCAVLRATRHANVHAKGMRVEKASTRRASPKLLFVRSSLHGRRAHAGRHQRVLPALPTDTAQRFSDDVDYYRHILRQQAQGIDTLHAALGLRRESALEGFFLRLT